jgi:hypothetical protein
MMDDHVQKLRELETSLFPTGEAAIPAGAACVKTPLGVAVDYKKGINFHTLSQQHMDVALMALGCGRTKVAVLQMGDHNGDEVNFHWIGLNKGYHYDIQHKSADVASHVKAETWLTGQYAYFLTKLKGIPSGTSSLLHDSVVLWASLMSNAGAHSQHSMCYAIGGRAGGLLEGGRYLKYGDITDKGGNQPVAHNDLLLSLCHLMGLRDVQTFGDPKYCTGGLKNLIKA